MTAELKGIHAKTFQDLDVIKDVLKLDEEKIVDLEKENLKVKQACHKWFMRWREAKKDALYFDNNLQKQIEATLELHKENAELKAQLESERDLPAIAYQQGAENQKKKDEEELKKWKDEWQEQVQKATDEGYARTLQTTQLTNAKKILKKVVADFHNMDCVTVHIDKTIAEAEQFLKENV